MLRVIKLFKNLFILKTQMKIDTNKQKHKGLKLLSSEN